MQTTVHEALWFSCRLRFTNDINDVTARAFVDEVSELNKLVLNAFEIMPLPPPHLNSRTEKDRLQCEDLSKGPLQSLLAV